MFNRHTARVGKEENTRGHFVSHVVGLFCLVGPILTCLYAIAGNAFSGSVPTEYARLTNVETLDYCKYKT